jgi:pyridoxamine 5'-phosphate oxidase
MSKDIADIRREYLGKPLSKKDVNDDPFLQFKEWFDEAYNADVYDPNAMTLATSSAFGKVTSRIVLLKGLNEDGFIFYTNYNSIKSKQIEDNSFVSLVFYWPELVRQVRLEGRAEKISEEESSEYFDQRPEESKISAIASNQSSEIPDRKFLEEKIEQIKKQYNNEHLKRPDFWGGYIVKPFRFEFWQGRENRVHDRIEYYLEAATWKIRRLAP